jgi:hypothetical protein
MPGPHELAIERAIKLIGGKYGSLRDLPEELRQVVWVTAYRASAIGLKIEADGGPMALMKSMLIDGGRDAKEFEACSLQLQFLEQMVPIVRSAEGRQKLADAQLAVDILKWGIEDAANMSAIRRMIARKFAKADSLYEMAVPEGVLL